MPYRSIIVDPITKQSETYSHTTLAEHRAVMIRMYNVHNDDWKDKRGPSIGLLLSLAMGLYISLLISVVVLLIYVVITAIAISAMPERYNPVKRSKHARLLANAYRLELARACHAPDAQILTPER
ncbi:MAG: hypothetical protein JWM07_280 [Candidatus Saccharibacteria bacterium]|jgi:hypothetical protein|nr:hypothetical protein [Candidatus Saccharibacteria bacterium]